MAVLNQIITDREIRTWIYDGLVSEVLMRAIQATYPELILDAQRVAEDHMNGLGPQQMRWMAAMKCIISSDSGEAQRLVPMVGGEGGLVDLAAYVKKNKIVGYERI